MFGAVRAWAGHSGIPSNTAIHFNFGGLSLSHTPTILPLWNSFKVAAVRNFATSPDKFRSMEPNKGPGQSSGRVDERSEILSFMESQPPHGIGVTIYPGNDLQAAEKLLRRKVNQEGVLQKYREMKVRDR